MMMPITYPTGSESKPPQDGGGSETVGLVNQKPFTNIMDNIKIRVTIALQGGVMYDRKDCYKLEKVPVINKRGKYAGKQARDRKGRPVFKDKLMAIPEMTEHIRLELDDYATGETKTLHVHVPKCKPASQTINMCQAAYDYFTSTEVPHSFTPPAGFEPSKKLTKAGVPKRVQAWQALSPEGRLLWHLHKTAEHFGGKLKSYQVFDE